MTSFDVVARVRRLAGEKRVGHAGTLDPLATGVLPVCVGQATRIVEYLSDSSKAYCGEIALGVSTDTDDAEGRVIAQADPSGITRQQFEAAISGFVGNIEQIPPAYSAIKVGGRKLYELARAGAEISVAPRSVEVFSIRLIDFEVPVAVVEVECSKGTYIRSLARDIGQKLGVGGYLQHLVRTRSGPFTIDDAVPLPELAQAFELDYWRSIIYPVDEALLRWPAIIVGPQRECDLQNGRPIPTSDRPKQIGAAKADSIHSLSADVPPDKCRAYGFDGQLLAVVHLDAAAAVWRPQKVFALGD